MDILDAITRRFVAQSGEILKDALIGIYLHGSAVMGCFHEKTSDIDFIVVVNASIPDEIKRRYMDMVVELNAHAPKKGIELSVVREEVCKPFIYPTPFELHFSIAHLQWYRTDPDDYIRKMNGLDKDLAAHFTIIYHRGKCLWGKQITDVFEEIDQKFYFDSMWSDIENAETDILANPAYIILNLCRVLAYAKDGLILSKQEGGDWGLGNVPEKYHDLILQALAEYSSDAAMKPDEGCACGYAAYMLEQIRSLQ